MATDPYGQGISYPDPTSPPNGPAQFKTLTEELTRRSNLVYASAAARNAAIVSPQAGMQAWLADAKILTVYDGTTWLAASTGTSTWTDLVLAAGFAHNGNSNGNAQWRLVSRSGSAYVELRGAITVTYAPGIPNGGVLNSTALPVSPAALRTVLVPCSDSNSERIGLKLDARTDGKLEITGTNTTNNRPPWVGFHNVAYSL